MKAAVDLAFTLTCLYSYSYSLTLTVNSHWLRLFVRLTVLLPMDSDLWWAVVYPIVLLPVYSELL